MSTHIVIITALTGLALVGCDNTSAPEATKKPITETSTADAAPMATTPDSPNLAADENNKTIVTATAGSATATGEIAAAE